MTPAERQLVTELFDRLATLEDAPRDPEAERLIRDGLAQAPNAVYALVQTALVQDEALRLANQRIQELEAGAQPARSGGFLDSMRNNVFGRDGTRGSVPSVRPPDAPMGAPPGFGNAGAPGAGPTAMAQPAAPPAGQPASGRGSFLGTAAAAAAGVIGGSMLLDGIRSMTGQRSGGMHMADQAAAREGGGSPWGFGGGGGGRGSDDLARQAGLDDIGRSGGGGAGGGPFGQGMFNDRAERAGKGGETDRDARFDDAQDAQYDDTTDAFAEDDAFDDGGDSGGFGSDD